MENNETPPLKPGDRVGWADRANTRVVAYAKMRGTVREVLPNGSLVVYFDCDQQCSNLNLRRTVVPPTAVTPYPDTIPPPAPETTP